MRNEDPKLIYLKDYQPSRFLVDSIHLEFTLEPKATRVISEVKFRANPKLAPAPCLDMMRFRVRRTRHWSAAIPLG